ncbi:MAG TPA: MarR family transcriptional regulator [Micrococcales bacterium]|uniref:MarR family winged helix-turn-helix transcriptional regulator n=1 Tax=Miniimonas arenae TaxID=676201 RepID=UPI000ED44CB7|nr:MarR family transcriptional regulator [Miniimonas arenae]HCX85941.1 MarR family transcriptional regulator [Micrococcales bacterium]
MIDASPYRLGRMADNALLAETRPDVADDTLADLAELAHAVARDVGRPDGDGVVPLTHTEVMVLKAIEDRPDATPGAVAEATSLQRSNVSAALAALVRKGFVERRPDGVDGRVVHLHLTALAHASRTTIRGRWAARVRLGVEAGSLTAADVEATVRVLGALADGLAATRD